MGLLSVWCECGLGGTGLRSSSQQLFGQFCIFTCMKIQQQVQLTLTLPVWETTLAKIPSPMPLALCHPYKRMQKTDIAVSWI